jgi:hypothetical protein
MASQQDADALRVFWQQDALLQYKDKWIAFRNNEVLLSATELDELLGTFKSDIHAGNSPIFAHVQVGIVQ